MAQSGLKSFFNIFLRRLLNKVRKHPRVLKSIAFIVLRIPWLGVRLKNFSSKNPRGLDVRVNLPSPRQWDHRVLITHDRFAESKNGCKKNEKKKLALVTPWPPERSGIADYCRELASVLNSDYLITVVVSDSTLPRADRADQVSFRSSTWFVRNARQFDFVVYHMGNSHFHSYMLPLIEKIPGIVMLHDFYLGHLVGHMDIEEGNAGFLLESLYLSHGLRSVLDYKTYGPEYVLKKWPSSGRVIRAAKGVLVHSKFTKKLVEHYFPINSDILSMEIPFLKVRPEASDRMKARVALGIEDDEFVVCSFGFMGPYKLNIELILGWMGSDLCDKQKCRLVFVGEESKGDYGAQVKLLLKKCKNISVSGYLGEESYKNYLQAADLAVQLRSNSRGETSAAVYDCLAYGVPLIVNEHGSAIEIPDSSAAKISEVVDSKKLAKILRDFYDSEDLRRSFAGNGVRYILDYHNESVVRKAYSEAFERFYPHCFESDFFDEAKSKIPVIPRRYIGCKEIQIDISAIARVDLKTGIQRVVRSTLIEIIKGCSDGTVISPVMLEYCWVTSSWKYVYAGSYVSELLGFDGVIFSEGDVLFSSGDKLLVLDYFPQAVEGAQQGLYRDLKSMGVEIYFTVYDMLPVSMPQYFPEGTKMNHIRWFDSLSASADGALCISRSVAQEVYGYLGKTENTMKVGWFRLGSEFTLSKGIETKSSETSSIVGGGVKFIMVGTVEPRKGHRFVFDVFESLWAKGEDVVLILVGKRGWMMDDFCDRIQEHSLWEKKIFWYESASDEVLSSLYSSCSALIAASEGEGFGLPLIEAIQMGIPVIARDIPVFREVCSENAEYFATEGELFNLVVNWGNVDERMRKSLKELTVVRWSDSAKEILDLLFNPSDPKWIYPKNDGLSNS